MKVRLVAVSAFLLFILPLFLVAVNAQGPEGMPPENVIRAEPVHGLTIGPGKKLWVFVFPAKASAPDICTDGDQNLYSLLGFQIPATGLTFNINNGSIPIDPGAGAAISAITNSFNTWMNVDPYKNKIFTVNFTGGASIPAEDGINTVGWVYIVPRNVLAAAWIWTTVNNAVETVTDADIFYNLFHKWGVFSTCKERDRFEVQNVGTHEVGHVIGLGHVSDTAAMATMYPSAPKGEVKKQTLTTGDIAGATTVSP